MRTAALLSVSVAALAFSGCGTSDDDSGNSEPALTKAQLIKQGDAICTSLEKEQSRAAAAYLKEHPEAEEGRAAREEFLVEVGLPAMQEAIDELQSLSPPIADKDEVEAILTRMEEGLQESEESPISILTGQSDAFKEANARAARYGFEACSESP